MSFFLNPAFACDYYKIGHPFMQPPGSEGVYSTWTARSYKHHPGCPKTVVFGYQYTMEYIKDLWDENFFGVDIDELEDEWKEFIRTSFNAHYTDFSKFRALHELGYLPLEIHGVPEGTLLPIGIPDHVIFSTDKNFAWLPQFIEDQWSANNWMPSTSATTAYYRRQILRPYVEKMCENQATLDHMCGDFSLRGHTSLEAGILSGAAHLLSFDRTATVASNQLLATYYDADLSDPAKVPGLGTPSLEHSVVEQGVAWMKGLLAKGKVPDYCQPYVSAAMMEGNWDANLIGEMCFILYLIHEVQPDGVMTYVSDTYDYWGVVGKILPLIKDEILKRNGCFSVRPDSGNPTNIICGLNEGVGAVSEWEQMGTLCSLFKIFGGTKNRKGYMVLPPQVRMIYGDAITPEITKAVCEFCEETKISIENICFGIGAYTYQYVTRDTRGYAIKATEYKNELFGEIPIYKMPKTDPGKKSPRGAVKVLRTSGPNGYAMKDGFEVLESINDPDNVMVLKFRNGELFNHEDFYTIKQRLRDEEARDNS